MTSTISCLRATSLRKRGQYVVSFTTTRSWSLFRTKPTAPDAQSQTQAQAQAQSQPQPQPQLNRADASTSTGKDGKVDAQAHVERELKKPKKTMTQIDEELRMAMEGMAGDGGDSGVELEDGKPVSMKRGVRENMFRYI